MTETLSLVEKIREQVASDQLQLPVFHHVALRLQHLLAKEDFNINQVAALIMEDQALVSQVLRMANSAFFAGLSKVATIRDAIIRLGARQVADLVMLVTQQHAYRSDHPLIGPYIHMLWKHALGCALGSKWLASRTGFKELTHEALLAGLLHDIGKLFLLKVVEDLHTSGTCPLTLTKAVIDEVLDTLTPSRASCCCNVGTSQRFTASLPAITIEKTTTATT